MARDLDTLASDISELATCMTARIRANEVEATFVALTALRRHVDALELAAYDHWKSAGLSYSDIGDPIGVVRNNVYRRHQLLREK
jgi:hypothetical protein